MALGLIIVWFDEQKKRSLLLSPSYHKRMVCEGAKFGGWNGCVGWMDGWEFGRLTKTVRVWRRWESLGTGIFFRFLLLVGLSPLFSNFGSKPVDVSATIRCQAFAPGRKNQSKKGRGQGACETRAYRHDTIRSDAILTAHRVP